MNFKKAQIITNELFENVAPINVFHKENEPQSFTHPEEYENKHILFRQKFNVEKIEKTTIDISADDYYKLYINGIFVTQGPAPGYNFSYYYNEIDVTEFLVEGENTIAVHTYYQGLINRVWVSGDLRHMLVCEVKTADKILCATDTSWKTTYHTAYGVAGKNYGYDTGFCELYNAGGKEVGFEQVNFDDSYWAQAVVKQNCYYKFVKQDTKQLDIYNIKPQIIEKNKDGYFIDIGQEVVGYITFKATGAKGSEIIIKSGEELNEDGSVRYELRCNCVYKETFVIADGVSTYVQYDYKAFRYFQIEIPNGVDFDADSFEIIVRHYPFKEAIPCPSENEDIKKIWNLCSNTIKFGMQEVLMDCPTREKGQYLGDGTITAIANTIITGDTTFMKKTLRDFTNSSFIADSIMTVSTSSLMQEIADYSLQFPLQVLWMYNYSGDMEFLKEMQPYVKAVLNDFKYYENEDGLLDHVFDKWNLVDWPANLRDNYDFPLTKPIGTGLHNVINAFYYGAIVADEKINDILGISYENKSDAFRKTFNDAFFNEETSLYVDTPTSTHSSIHSNILPLLYSMKPEKAEVIANYVSGRGVDTCGVYIAMFMLLALRNTLGKEEVEKQVACPGAWLKMLSEGATTCYEAWGKEDKWNTSLFHPWATAPIIALTDTKFPF